MVLCNPRDPEAAHRADVGDIATTDDRAQVTCKRCLAALGRVAGGAGEDGEDGGSA